MDRPIVTAPTVAGNVMAGFAGHQPGDPVGHGMTAYDAILDLLADAERVLYLTSPQAEVAAIAAREF